MNRAYSTAIVMMMALATSGIVASIAEHDKKQRDSKQPEACHRAKEYRRISLEAYELGNIEQGTKYAKLWHEAAKQCGKTKLLNQQNQQ